jgi:predicted Zn finger-like uncharacterized protein
MPEIISCSECHRQLRVPDDMIGKKVKCPSCGLTFVASTEAPSAPKPAPRSPRSSEGIEQPPPPRERSAPAPARRDDYEDDRPRQRRRDDDEDDRPRQRRRDDDDDDDDDRPRRRQRDDDYEEEELTEEAESGWRRVRTGLTLIITYIFSALGGGLLLGIGFVTIMGVGLNNAIGSGGNQAQLQNSLFGMGTGFVVWVGIAVLFGLALAALLLVGVGYHMAVPEQRGVQLKKLALTTFILFCASIAAPLLLLALAFVTPFAVFLISPIGQLLNVAAFTAYILLMRGICNALGRTGLAGVVHGFLITFLSIVGVEILIYVAYFALLGTAFLSMAGGGPPPGAALGGAMGVVVVLGLFNCLVLLGIIGLFIWFIVLLFQVRGEVDSYLRRR